jgi:4-hydroxy-tetrahydrodipicolinate synthase
MMKAPKQSHLSGPPSAGKLRGTLPVVPTPFYNGKVDFDSFLRLLDYIFPQLDGYTICGSTGESVSLSRTERLELIRFAAENTPKGKRVVVGLTHTNLEECKDFARAAADLGLYAGLIPAPYYFPNSTAMVREFMRTLDQASDLDLVFYDNPIYTKTWLRAEELCAIADACKHLVGVKMTDHDLDKVAHLQEKGLSVFAGDDVLAFRSLLMGMDGSMIIAPAVFPAAYQRTATLLAKRDAAAALQCFAAEVLPFIHLFGIGDEVTVTKAVYEHLGIFRSREARLPLLPVTEERLSQVLLAYDLCQSHSVASS